MSSPYNGLNVEDWKSKTEELIKAHPLKEKIVPIVLKAWDDIFNSQMGSFKIGKDIFPSPQIMSFFLHELVAHYLSLEYPKEYKVGEAKKEKDVHNIINPQWELKLKHLHILRKFLLIGVTHNRHLLLKRKIKMDIILELTLRSSQSLIPRPKYYR